VAAAGGALLDDATVGLIQQAVRGRRESMTATLLDWAAVESPSKDPALQDAMLTRVTLACEGLGMRVRRRPGTRTGGYLVAAPPMTSAPSAFQLLVGHADTVWPQGTVALRPPRVEDGTLRGPGTYDMKAGLIQSITALDVLRELGQVPEVVPVMLVNTDEEIGSRESTEAIAALARGADRAYVLEASLGPSGRIKTARKGLGRYRVVVHGRAAHAGLDPTAGASAILELSGVIQRLFALNDAERGVTVNVGMVEGGIQPNVVAPESAAEVDVRVLGAEDAERVDAAIRALTAQTPGTSVEVTGGMGRPPMERTESNAALFRAAREAGAKLGLDLGEGTAGGGSDGNTTSQYTPTLDGLGAVGDGAHAEHEYVDLDAWVDRTALLALMLMMPPVGRRRVPDPLDLLPPTVSS